MMVSCTEACQKAYFVTGRAQAAEMIAERHAPSVQDNTISAGQHAEACNAHA
jgi:hypothetical protein